MSDATPSTENRFMPGPWAISRDNREGMDWNNHIVSAADPNLTVCFMAHDGDGINARGEANARLIAAAPTMLAALKAAQKDLETVQHEMSGIAPEAISPALPLICAAIAKAEGRS